MHVYFTDFMHRQHVETPSVTGYLAFCDFGRVTGLYLGLSIIGLVEVLFYFSKLFYAFARMHYYRIFRAAALGLKPSQITEVRVINIQPRRVD